MANNVVILFPVYGEKKTQSFLWVHHSLVVMHTHFQDHCRLWERKLEQRKEWSLAVIKYHLRTVQIPEAVRPQCWAPRGQDGLCCRWGRSARVHARVSKCTSRLLVCPVRCPLLCHITYLRMKTLRKFHILQKKKK